MAMALLDLPNELLIHVAWFLLQCPICDCHHFTRNLYPLTQTNHHLHAVVTRYLLGVAEAETILLWAITHLRTDTVKLALSRGADPNFIHFERRYFSPGASNIRLGTAMDFISRFRCRSSSAISHQRKFDIIALLLLAGGKPTFNAVALAARCGDLDLLELYLPHIVDIDERHPSGGHTLLEVAGSRGNIQCMKILLAAGADVNCTGDANSPGHYPALWALSNAPAEVLQTLLDAGADATWVGPDGKSIAEDLLDQWRVVWSDVDVNIDLLARHGSRLPKGEQAIALWQAPIWEIWTGDGGESGIVDQLKTRRIHPGRREYRGWMAAAQERRGENLRIPGNPGCKCPDCPAEKTGRTRDRHLSPRNPEPGRVSAI